MIPGDRPKWEPASPIPAHWMVRFDLFSRLFERIKRLPGMVVECGVGRGTTFCMLAYFAGVQKRELRGYDSFRGFPEPGPQDAGWRNPQAGEWAVNETEVWQKFHATGLPQMFPTLRPVIIPGFLQDTLPREVIHDDQRVAFLHLDVDLYESYKVALEHFWPRMAQGGIVLFDEYREFSASHPTEEKWPGATKAVHEFFDTRYGSIVLTHDLVAFKWYVIK